jgi:DNA-binding NtrC family response regulator
MIAATPVAPQRPVQETWGLVGSAVPIVAIRDQVRRVAATHVPVLLCGATGTGKEVVARALHTASGRTGRWTPVNVAALPEQLVESELFGVTRGAFTGASVARQGLIEAASGGTLYLDEAGELSHAVQAKLLRVLDTQSVRRVGAVEHRAVDLRLVLSTQRPAIELVASGTWRADFFYRVAGVRITLPSLLERLTDVELLATEFLARMGRPPLGAATVSVLKSHPWPGNVRELRLVLETAAALTPDGDITPEAIRASIVDGGGSQPGTTPPTANAAGDCLRPLDDVERAHIEAVLQAVHGNTRAAATVLRLSTGKLYRRLRALGITPPRFRAR